MKMALGVEYDGRAFSGWEIQKDRETVQGVLEAALSGVADSPIRTICAGRTDAGVHAWGQVVHFETDRQRPIRAWVLGANSGLRGAVSVSWAKEVPEDFHARFSARRRHYRYVLLNRPARCGVLEHRVGWESRFLNVQVMSAAADRLLGKHDFSAFRASGCQARTPVRTIHSIDVRRYEQLIFIDVIANAFLKHMVRNVVGSLLEVGLGKQPVDWIEFLLNSRERSLGGRTMMPSGLYLLGVEYPHHFEMPVVVPPTFL